MSRSESKFVYKNTKISDLLHSGLIWGELDMSMIARYKKKGGFLQLLNLIETCGPQKQEKFLKMIEDEDVRWADSVRAKLLTIKRIFSWDDNAIGELAANLKDLTLACAIVGLDEQAKEKIYKMMNHARKRKIDDLIEEKKPNPAEVSTAFIQILTEVRRMITEGLLQLDKIDPELMFNSEFEDGLLSGSGIFKMHMNDDHTPLPKMEMPSAAEDGSAASLKHEIDQLRRMISHMTIENQKLKERVVQAEGKLQQIKKIA